MNEKVSEWKKADTIEGNGYCRLKFRNCDNTAIEKRVRQLGEKSGIGRRLYPHLFRHTMATDGLDRGMPVEEVQQILGHVDVATTMIYAQVSRVNVKNNHRRCIV